MACRRTLTRNAMDAHIETLDRENRPTANEENELIAAAQNGDRRAEERVILASQRLVTKIARRYASRQKDDLMDLVQEGNIGLVRAIQLFDAERGIRFGVYAAVWIRSKILLWLTRNRWDVRVQRSGDALRLLHSFGRTEARMLALHGEATDEAIAQELDVSVELVTEMRPLWNGPVHLDKTIGANADGSRTALDLVTVEGPDPELAAMRNERNDTLKSAVRTAFEKANLLPRDRFIIENRVMADDEDRLTQQAIGDTLGISRERARQLQVRALDRLKPILVPALELMEPIGDAETVPGTIPVVVFSPR